MKLNAGNTFYTRGAFVASAYNLKLSQGQGDEAHLKVFHHACLKSDLAMINGFLKSRKPTIFPTQIKPHYWELMATITLGYAPRNEQTACVKAINRFIFNDPCPFKIHRTEFHGGGQVAKFARLEDAERFVNHTKKDNECQCGCYVIAFEG